MAFEKNSMLVSQKHNLDRKEFSVECTISAGENVEKVLALCAGAFVKSSEVLDGTINYSGTVDLKLVFCNSEGFFNTVFSSCPFSSKFDSDAIEVGQDAFVTVKVLDYNVDSVQGDIVKVSVMLCQEGFTVSNKEIKTIGNGDDDECSLNEEIKVVKFVGKGSDEFVSTSEINIRDKVKKLILTQSDVYLKNVESGVNFVSFSGDVVTRVLYLNDNDKFESGYVYDSFKQEVELDGVSRECLSEGYSFVKCDEVKTEIVQDEKGDKISVSVPVVLNAFAFCEESAIVTKDCYSTKGKLSLTTESFDNTLVCTMDTIEERVEGSITLDEEKPRVDKILFSGGNSVTITNKFVQDGSITIQGIAKTMVVYLNDELGSMQSVQIDIPFSINEKTSFKDGGILEVDAVLCDVDVSVKKGREIFVDGKVKLSLNYCYNSVDGVITDAILSEPFDEKDYSMEVVFARKGQSLWDIAKMFNVKQEQIITQNPDTVFPLSEDASLVLFYQKVE